jgi:D-glycero-D-manno-heptose 1,7-bisphosphate phosphatase
VKGGGSKVNDRREKAVFLDRDGVINVRLPDGAYVTRREEFVFCEGVAEALRLLQEKGFLLIVVTNQRGIGRGLMTGKDLDDVHRGMREELDREGVTLDALYFCPHNLEDDCDCRKPRPGMLKAAMKRFDIDRKRSLIIGDSETDIEAGRAAGVGGVLIVPEGEEASVGFRTSPSLLAAAREIARDG